MRNQKGKGDFRAKEVLCSAPMRKGEELRFSVVEVDGKARADIRYFSEVGGGMWPTPRGMPRANRAVQNRRGAWIRGATSTARCR